MVVHVSQAGCRRRSALQLAVAQALIWASMMIAIAMVLRGSAHAYFVMTLLLAGATASLGLSAAACRRARTEADGDDESPR